MRPHTHVRRTERLIRSYDPCAAGLRRARKFLPASVSTDPEKNIDLAVSLLRSNVNVGWLTGEVKVDLTLGCGCSACTGPGNAKGLISDNSEAVDAGVVAQQLAAIADKLATARGR